MKLQAAHRLLAAEEWWSFLTPEQKKQYIKDHPGSKYAKEHIKDEELEEPRKPTKQLTPKQRSTAASIVKTHSPKIVKLLKESFPSITGATSALKHLATGKALTDDHKDVLLDLGNTALKTALKVTVGHERAHLVHTIGRVGVNAVKYAIEQFKKNKEQSKDKEDLEVFVDSVSDGLEHAPNSQQPKIQKGAIARHIKSRARHIANVLDKSFPHVKPATTGLVSLSTGKPLDEEQKKAVKKLGKVALGMSIAALPGGFAAHLVAGAGSAALMSALNAVRKKKVPEKQILVHFVESIGQGLEDELISRALGDA